MGDVNSYGDGYNSGNPNAWPSGSAAQTGAWWRVDDDAKKAREDRERNSIASSSGGFSASPSSYSSPTPYALSYPTSSPSYGSAAPVDPEAAGALLALFAIGAVLYGAVTVLLAFSNECTVLIGAALLIAGLLSSDHLKESVSGRVIAVIAAVAGVGLTMWGLHLSRIPEGTVFRALTRAPQLDVFILVVLLVALYPQTIWRHRHQIVAVPATLALFAGAIDGLSDSFQHQERNPFAAGAKAFGDTARVGGSVSAWFIGSKLPGYITCLPFDATASVGSFIGNVGTTAGRFVVRILAAEISRHTPKSTTQVAATAAPSTASAPLAAPPPAVARATPEAVALPTPVPRPEADRDEPSPSPQAEAQVAAAQDPPQAEPAVATATEDANGPRIPLTTNSVPELARAARVALNSGRTVRWFSSGAQLSGYVVVSAPQAYADRVCRNLRFSAESANVTLGNRDETACRGQDGIWRTG